MTDLERKAIHALANCSFLPGTFDKRIARQWAEKANKNPDEPLTEKGRRMLFILCHKYRRQISNNEVLAEAARVKGVETVEKPKSPSADALYRQELYRRGMRTIGEAGK